MTELFTFNKSASSILVTESAVQSYADALLQGNGFCIRHHKTGNTAIDKAWPSKTTKAKGKGAPDLLIYANGDDELPFCVWENKGTSELVALALTEAQFYIQGLHQKKAGYPNLPRVAAGFNGKELRISYLNFESIWVDVKVSGVAVVDKFPKPQFAIIGISANGNFNAATGSVRAADIRKALPALKTLYRSIPVVASGRRPIDFTVALLTLKMLVESNRGWGTWAEQPSLVPDATSVDQAVGERFKSLSNRILGNKALRAKYGDIFLFSEHGKDNREVAFNFVETLDSIDTGQQFFKRMFEVIDDLPPLHGADFDIFGEVYQAIGDDATKKALGEFFTGRHIISAVVPIILQRAGVNSFNTHLKGKSIADIACGTGGFLTESLRFIRKRFQLDESETRSFAAQAFHGYDLSHANASRARVNMYFAGDGFSAIDGGVDSLAKPVSGKGFKSFDFILTNPPYGASSQYQRLEEAFLKMSIALLKPGAGWGLIVVPTGVLENPRSGEARKNLLREAKVTDVISLPPHAFAPYTNQRTSIVIFQRRENPLAALSWPDLLTEVADEEIALFIVDNDGYANSDKRYETNRHNINGEWLHDDLRSWVDSSGKLQEGKLYKALIKKILPASWTDEFGDPLEEKYGLFTVGELAAFEASRGANKAGGIELLPDTYLRPQFSYVSFTNFEAAASKLIKEAKADAEKVTAGQSIVDRVRKLLSTPIDYSNQNSSVPAIQLKDNFDLVKGDQGLTEAVIYNQFEYGGLPVFGGGEAPPRFFLKEAAVTKAGIPVNVHVGPALLVSMDGSSGFVRVIKKGVRFAANHHGCVLKPKKGVKLDLNFVAQQAEGGLRSLASNKDGSATLTMQALNSFRFEMAPTLFLMKKVGARRRALAAIRDKFR